MSEKSIKVACAEVIARKAHEVETSDIRRARHAALDLAEYLTDLYAKHFGIDDKELWSEVQRQRGIVRFCQN